MSRPEHIAPPEEVRRCCAAALCFVLCGACVFVFVVCATALVLFLSSLLRARLAATLRGLGPSALASRALTRTAVSVAVLQPGGGLQVCHQLAHARDPDVPHGACAGAPRAAERGLLCARRGLRERPERRLPYRGGTPLDRLRHLQGHAHRRQGAGGGGRRRPERHGPGACVRRCVRRAPRVCGRGRCAGGAWPETGAQRRRQMRGAGARWSAPRRGT